MDLRDLKEYLTTTYNVTLDIDPMTVKEWHELVGGDKLYDNIKEVFEAERDCKFNVPAGYRRSEQQAGYAFPVPSEISLIISLLDRCRFKKNLTVREAADIARARKLTVSSHQAVVNMLDRFEQAIGLLPELPKSVKYKGNRQKLEMQRKRRELQKTAKEQRRARQEKKALEAKINKNTKKIIQESMAASVTVEELKKMEGQGLDENVKRLKEQAKSSDYEPPEELDDSRILFKPTPKQAEFLAAPEKVVLYGGAAGGGKSFALVFDAIRFAHRPAMRSLIIRRANSELKELISVTKQMYPKAFPGAKFNESKMIWTFPSGATLEFGYMDKPDDKERYIGLPYSYIGWDEIQLQKSPEAFDFLFSRLRTTDPEITCYVRCTGNPGGAPWVKQRFIDPAPYNTPFLRHLPGQEDDGLSYKFIPATMFDNPYLAEDGEYEKILKQMPAHKVQQLLYGNWDVVEDGFFNFDPDLHISDEFPPLHWPVVTSMDYGWNDPATCLWGAVDPETGAIHIYRELEMINRTVEQWAQAIKHEENKEQFTPITDRVVDWTMFKMTGHTGPSHLETLTRYGFRMKPADRNREAGWAQVNQRLLPNLNGEPMLYVHRNCKRLIDQLQTATPKETNPDDIDQTRIFSMGRKHHWDLLDTLRYMCMARPRTDVQDLLIKDAKQTAAWKKYNDYFSL